jgi:hypothetical protein
MSVELQIEALCQAVDQLKLRVAALENLKATAPGLEKELVKIYPQSIEGQGLAYKDGEIFKPFKERCQGRLTDIQKYTSKYKDKDVLRLVFVISGESREFHINVGASTVFARSLGAALGECTYYSGLSIGGKVSEVEKNVVFADVTQNSVPVKSNCKNWTEADVLDSVATVLDNLKKSAYVAINNHIKADRFTKTDMANAATRMFQKSSAADLTLTELKAVHTECLSLRQDQ